MISVVIPSYNRRDGMLALLADVYPAARRRTSK